jgi:hypothetical protein
VQGIAKFAPGTLIRIDHSRPDVTTVRRWPTLVAAIQDL